MKIATNIITYFVALVYFVLGLNFFLHFIPMPPMEGTPGAYIGILASTGFMFIVKIIEIAVAIMLVANFKRPLAWLLILPISVNILMFEVFIAKQPGIGILLVLLNLFMVYAHKDKYQSIVS